LVPAAPVWNEVGVGAQHPRRLLARAENADRLELHDDERVVGGEMGGSVDDACASAPATGNLDGAVAAVVLAVVLGDLEDEVVHQHPHGRFLGPALAGQVCSGRGADRAWSGGHLQSSPGADVTS